jgi:hypothetical protein
MRRAFVGFSTPVGYDYRRLPKTQTVHAVGEPDPVIYGSTGLICLYDEIWFASDKLCPLSMRQLPYVKFIDQHAGPLDLVRQGLDDTIKAIVENCVTPDRFEFTGPPDQGHRNFMREYVGKACDDHRNRVSFFGKPILPKMGIKEIVTDLWILDRYRELSLDLILNPFTAETALTVPNSRQNLENVFAQAEAAEKLLTTNAFHDFRGNDGPYHPMMEDLRDDPTLKAFRKWLSEAGSRWDNKDFATIKSDVDEVLSDFTSKALLSQVERPGIVETVLSLAKDPILQLVTGANLIEAASKFMRAKNNADEHSWKAYIGRARITLDRASRSKPARE